MRAQTLDLISKETKTRQHTYMHYKTPIPTLTHTHTLVAHSNQTPIPIGTKPPFFQCCLEIP